MFSKIKYSQPINNTVRHNKFLSFDQLISYFVHISREVLQSIQIQKNNNCRKCKNKKYILK